MFKPVFFFLLLIFCCFVALAQQKMQIKGLIFENKNSKRLSGVEVINNTTKESIISDEWGNFIINVAIGDTIVFRKLNYREQEKVITQKQNLIIYLNPAIALEEVTVKIRTKSSEQKEILEGYQSKGVFYNGKPPLLAYIFSPLTALNELIGTDANNARKFGNYIQKENAQTEVDRHFNIMVIKKAVPIKDDEIVEFMYLYRPKPEDVRYRNYYDDMKYVKNSYQDYLKNKKGTL